VNREIFTVDLQSRSRFFFLISHGGCNKVQFCIWMCKWDFLWQLHYLARRWRCFDTQTDGWNSCTCNMAL